MGRSGPQEVKLLKTMRGVLVLINCALAVLWAADTSLPRIYYSKSFPKSTPAFVGITVDKSGAGEYKEAEDDDNPIKFKLNENETAEIFGLAEKLNWFKRPLE